MSTEPQNPDERLAELKRQYYKALREWKFGLAGRLDAQISAHIATHGGTK